MSGGRAGLTVEEHTRRWLAGEQVRWVHLIKCSGNFLRELLPLLVDASTSFEVTPLPWDQWVVGYNAPVDLELLGWRCSAHDVTIRLGDDCPACEEARASET